MTSLKTTRQCPYCASRIRLGDCPIVATSFVGVEFGAEKFQLGDIELYSRMSPLRLLPKTKWPVLEEAPLKRRAEEAAAQRGESSLEQAFGDFASADSSNGELSSPLDEGLQREDVPVRACPVCEFPLPQSIDYRPVVVIAVVGVNRVGKTHLLASSLTEACRQQRLRHSIGCTEFVPDETTGKRFMESYFNPLFRRGEILEPTQADDEVRLQPLVFDVTLESMEPFSLVFHDVAGEVLGDHRMRARSATYLHGAQGIIFVVDPRDIDRLRDVMPQSMVEEDDLGWDQGTLLAACLQPDGLLDRSRMVPVAVAIAKSDVLPQVTGERLPFLDPADPGESKEEFVERIRATSRQVQEFLDRNQAHNILGPARTYERKLREADVQVAVTFHAFSALGRPPAEIEQSKGRVQPINCLDPLATILSQL